MADNIFGSEAFLNGLDKYKDNYEELVNAISNLAHEEKVSYIDLLSTLESVHSRRLLDDENFYRAHSEIIKNYFSTMSREAEMFQRRQAALAEMTKNMSEEVKKAALDSLGAYVNHAKIMQQQLDETVIKIAAAKQAMSAANELGDKEAALQAQKALNDATLEQAEIARRIFTEKLEENTRIAESLKRLYAQIEQERQQALDKARAANADAQTLNAIEAKYDRKVDSLNINAPVGGTYESQQAQMRYNQQEGERILSTVGTLASGGGYTGLAPAVDLGINSISKSGSAGAVIGSVLKVLKSLAENILSRMDAAYKVLQSSIDQSNDLVSKLKGDIDTRLQGLEDSLDFDSIVNTLFNTAYNSAVVNQKAYMENISRLVDAGVAYNLEERAMLMTVSDRIAKTFDALDKNLERLIRLQQADLTASQLGSEASITSFLNQTFNNSSYLTDEYDTVTATLLDATAQMNVDQATSFMYAVQKWLGSLYSLGLSGQAVNTIAQGLTYLSTGNVNQLNSNNSMQTLFAMAAENANISYSSMLTGGLDASTVDALLASMVQYLGQIANNTAGNQVTKAQWADILGLSLSDFRAISNVTSEDMGAILGQGNFGYNEAVRETQQQLRSDVIGRMSAQELISNILENAVFQRGMQIAMDPEQARQYLFENFARQFEGKGSVFEKFGHWLQEVVREFDTESESLFNYGDVLLAATSLVSPDKASSLMSKALAFLSGNPTDADTLLSMMYEQQMNPLKLTNWGGTIYNQSRGRDFSGLSPTAVGIAADLIDLESYASPFTQTTSSSTNVVSSLADNIVSSFDGVQQAVEASAAVVTSVNDTTTDSMEKLYHMLFEEQSIPIKVFLEGVSDEFKETFEEFSDRNNMSLGDALALSLSRDGTISNMISTIQALKGV